VKETILLQKDQMTKIIDKKKSKYIDRMSLRNWDELIFIMLWFWFIYFKISHITISLRS